MERDDKTILEQIRRLEFQAPEGKKENVMVLIRVYLEVMKRCPYLTEMPKEEQMELLRILKEQGIV
ncbi:MAG: hypothetical protein II983_02700 [Firmicutes bacterium]|nr:hypothetical protein [Bacillota bacterium]MBQ4504556.1 hypothetical protein [Bacillota bacterium]